MKRSSTLASALRQSVRCHSFDVFALTILLFLPSTPAVALGPGAGWIFQRTITLSAATPSANFQIRVQLVGAAQHANMNAIDGRDLRFYDASNVQADYWIETWNPSGTSTIWVETPTSGTSTLTMYYGNVAATAVSNGDLTFLSFDDFSGNAVNAAKWDKFADPNNSVVVSGGSLTLTGGDQLISKTSFAMSAGVLIETVLSSNVPFGTGSRASMSGASSLSGTSTFFSADEPVNSRFAAWSNGRDNVYGVHTVHEGDGVDNGPNTSQYIRIVPFSNAPGTWVSNGFTMGAGFESGRLEYFLNFASQGSSTTNVPAVTMFPLLNTAIDSFQITTFRTRKFSSSYNPIVSVGAESLAPVCGNTVSEAGEQCDDGNIANGDCCSSTCQFESSGSSCGSASDTVCDDADSCNGSGSCQSNNEPNTVECRAVAGTCDVAENCDGAGSCPADAFSPSATVCRALAGVCDISEHCTGSGAACPGDGVASAVTVCRSVAGVCDVAESCDGVTVDCPADASASASTVCRSAVDVCDVSESCTGTGPNCPPDAFASSATVCRGASDVCDLAESCTGGSAPCPGDAVAPPTTVCRPATSSADAAESCDGSTKACPADAVLAAGTPCDDGSFCTQRDEADGSGGCVGLDPVDCSDANPCTDDTCDSQGGGFLCEHDNNGLCIGPNCGNLVVDAGETCDPPNLALDPVTNQIECRYDCTSCGDSIVQANDGETCDDGNTVSGCRPDRPQQALDGCLNNCSELICADPAQIKFGVNESPDLFSFHGRLISDVPVDFANQHFVIELRDASGSVIYRSSLVSGSIEPQNVKSMRYKSRGARAAGGVYQLKTKAGVGYYVLTLKAYGDLSAAVADMTTHAYVGSDEWVVRGLWTAQGSKGWKLPNKQSFLPVQ